MIRGRGHALLAVSAAIAIISIWLATASTGMDVDWTLQRARERDATAYRLAEMGLELCRRGQSTGWLTIRSAEGHVGRLRAERISGPEGGECVGWGEVPATARHPAVQKRVVGPLSRP